MKTIERNIVSAIYAGENRLVGNTEVRVADGVREVYLHGNLIASITGQNVHIDMCGWPTATTRSRINAILEHFGLPYQVRQRRHRQWLVSKANDEKQPFPDAGMMTFHVG